MRTSETAAEAVRRYKNAINNAQGHSFEGYIKAACALYAQQGRAEIDKTPEPFRVTAKDRKNGTFSGRFTARAQPDFQGTLDGGRSLAEPGHVQTGAAGVGGKRPLPGIQYRDQLQPQNFGKHVCGCAAVRFRRAKLGRDSV